jgi:cytochrome c556
MRIKFLITICFFICGTAIYCVASVESEAVKARTKAMSEISDNMRVLGLMLKGQVDFDLVSAKSAIQNIEKLAAKTPTLFEIEAVDPHAEAKPEIWSNYEDFVEKALTLQTVATAASRSLVSEEGLKDVIMSMGKTCKSCHSLYRN